MKKLITSTAVLAALIAASDARATTILGIDASSGSGVITWSKVKASGADFAFVRATEGYDFSEDSSYSTNMTKGKAAGLQMGAYTFSHPYADTPAQEASYFWNFASPDIKADGDSISPAIDFEVFSGTLGGESYTSFFNDWSTDVKGKTTNSMHPAIYASACSGMCDLTTACSLAEWVGSLGTASPWTDCDACNYVDPNTTSGWTYWFYETGSIGGVSGSSTDFNQYNGSLASLKSTEGVGGK